MQRKKSILNELEELSKVELPKPKKGKKSTLPATKTDTLTEDAIRILVRDRAKESSAKKQTISLDKETVGILQQIYKSDDMSLIIKQLTEDALIRYAKLEALEQRFSNTESTDNSYTTEKI